jgi:hypothetical protein
MVREETPMSLDDARQWAAQCWCQPETQDRVMDAALCEEFARLLESRVNEAVAWAEFVAARKHIAWKLQADHGLRIGYVANVAMLLSDRYGMTEPATRDEAARAIICLIFGIDRKDFPSD